MDYLERQKLERFRNRLTEAGFLSASDMTSIIGNSDRLSEEFWKEVYTFAVWEETPRVGCRLIGLPHQSQVLSQFI